MNIKKEKIKAFDMTCTSCENRIERAIKALPGVLHAQASFCEQNVEVEYDTELCTLNQIKEAIKKAGYRTEGPSNFSFTGILLIVGAVIILGMSTRGIDMESMLSGASYLMLFVVGALTSIHCVGMCGGIMLSQTMSKESTSKFDSIKPALLYNLGRVVSYTVIGGIIGALGSVLSLSVQAKSALQIFAGVFMIIMGFNMTGFPLFRKLQIHLPWSSCSIASKKKIKAPFLVGILNGLMPCGPLQSMQLYALGTGSAITGALSMLMFSIGTVPLMLTFGALSGLLSRGYTKKLLKFSGILIIVLGIIMGNRGLALAGININPMTALTAGKYQNSVSNSSDNNIVKPTIKDGVQIINMTADGRGYTPNILYVKKDVPVKWVIDGKQITSCNNAVVVPTLNIQKKLKSGENIIEFKPEKTGDINFSCWMGMIRGVIKVVDDIDTVDTSKTDNSVPPSGTTGGSCCGGGNVSQAPSIYGSDLNTVPTATLVNKALSAGKYESITIKGIGYEFKPLISVITKDYDAKITFDLTEFDNPEGKFEILDAENGNLITSFNGKKGAVPLQFNAKKSGGYAIIKDGSILGIIEAVDNLKDADLQKIRDKYLK